MKFMYDEKRKYKSEAEIAGENEALLKLQSEVITEAGNLIERNRTSPFYRECKDLLDFAVSKIPCIFRFTELDNLNVTRNVRITQDGLPIIKAALAVYHSLHDPRLGSNQLKMALDAEKRYLDMDRTIEQENKKDK